LSLEEFNEFNENAKEANSMGVDLVALAEAKELGTV
jgi:hypothetical protein